MDTAVAENVGNTVGGGCAPALKTKMEQPSSDNHGEVKTSNDLPNAWKVNRDLTGGAAGIAKNIQSAKTLHSSNGIVGNNNGGSGISNQGHYGTGSFHDKDFRGKPRQKYSNRPTPKIVEPIVTDKEEDWPTLGTALGSKSATGLGLNGTGLLNGFTKNYKRSSSTDSPSTSSRTNSIIGQDDAERASIVSGEGGDNSTLDGDQVDGELSNKLHNECTVKSEGANLPKETNNNELGKSEEDMLDKRNTTPTRCPRGKVKWRALPLPDMSPNRPLRPRRWEEKDSTARNGVASVVNGPGRVSQSTITNFNSQNDSSQHSTNVTPSGQRGKGQNRTSSGRGGHYDYHGYDDERGGHYEYYEDRRRNNSYSGRAYYGGRPRGGGPGRWQHSRGGGASRSGRQEDEEEGNATVRSSQSNGGDGHQSQENHHAGNGGGSNTNSYAGAISNSNNRTGSRSGDYNYAGKNTQYPSGQYAEVVAVSYPYGGESATLVVTTQSFIPITTTGLTITTSIMDQAVLTSSSPSPNVTVQQFVMPFSRSTESPLTPTINSPPPGGMGIPTSTTMEQVVDEHRLRAMVTKQITYYLSPENLEQDFYLRRQMNPDGYIDIDILAGFHRLKGMTSNLELILEVILSCPDKFELNAEMTRVRPRVNPTMWPVVRDANDIETEPGSDSALTDIAGMTPVVSYNAEYPQVEYYTMSPPIAPIAVAHHHHGYQAQSSISSASSSSSLACASLSPGLLRPFKLNPDVPEFVPRGSAATSPDVKNESTDKSA